MSEMLVSVSKEAKHSRRWRRDHPRYYTAYLKRYHKEWRAKKKKQNLCTRCGNNLAKEGRVTCQECLSKNTARGKAHPETMKCILESDHTKVKEALAKENKHCALCGSAEHNGKGWNIDHCHVTSRFRGLLCSNCNTGLGQFKDSVQLLNKAIEYLRKGSEDVR